MRVLAVTNAYPTERFPAVGTFIQQQVEGLRRLGIVVDVLHIERFHSELNAKATPSIAEGLRAYAGTKRRVRRRIRSSLPDVVHVMYGGVMAEIVTRAVRDVPVVVSFCGSDLLGEPALTLLRRLAIRAGVLASYAAAKRADAIVVKSLNLRNALPRCIDRAKIHTIANGVDLSRFQPMHQGSCRQRLAWRAGVFHVLFPSYPEQPRKRFGLAKAAVDLLRSRGLAIDLHQLDGIPHDEIPFWLNASDCVILTSVMEGSPNIVKEALACDRSVVSVDVGDVSERLDGVAGCFITLDNAEDLAAKLRLVLEGPYCLRVDGRSHMQQLSLEAAADRLREVYNSVDSKGGAEWRAITSMPRGPCV